MWRPRCSQHLEALAAKADLVLHVKVESQRAFERQHYPPDGGAPGHPEIITANQVRVLRSFKGSAVSTTASTISIVQPGGSIDRGDSVDTQIAHSLGPFNVGDEYVVFLRTGEGGDLLIHQLGEGAFRLRNGRVDPLGTRIELRRHGKDVGPTGSSTRCANRVR